MQLSRQHTYNLMTQQEKINRLIHDMEFNWWMYEKHREYKNNRYDLELKKEIKQEILIICKQICSR